MPSLDPGQTACLVRLALALVDQQHARIAVPPQATAPGFWFGGGNLVQDDQEVLYLVGRYRNAGDSRTGLAAGERGLELAIFRSTDRGTTFDKCLSFSKRDLERGGDQVLSIEGSALHWTAGGVELFVSSEKAGLGYPPGFEPYLKPGAGVWTIERLWAEGIGQLADAVPATVVQSRQPQFLHVKDPVVYDNAQGDLVLLFCSHPFCWTSSNSGYTLRRRNETDFQPACFQFFPRGCTWDVAMTRITGVVDVPAVGRFRERRVSLVFYDGGECVRRLDEHQSAVRRPRGYSCEELGGVACLVDGRWDDMPRLSENFPLLISPHGTGCSRYVDVLPVREGLIATWQQSQPDGSQPLVIHFLPHDQVTAILSE